jgi:hypothetical protein
MMKEVKTLNKMKKSLSKDFDIVQNNMEAV